MDLETLRGLATSSNNTRMTVVKVQIGGQEAEIGVLQASMDTRKKVMSFVGISESKQTFAQMTRAKISAVIECACDPKTRVRLFGAEHVDTLMEQPAGGWVDRVADEAIRLMNGQALEEVSKNSEATPSGS